MRSITALITLAAAALPALAADPTPLPEPGSMALVGIALAVVIGLAVRKKK